MDARNPHTPVEMDEAWVEPLECWTSAEIHLPTGWRCIWKRDTLTGERYNAEYFPESDHDDDYDDDDDDDDDDESSLRHLRDSIALYLRSPVFDLRGRSCNTLLPVILQAAAGAADLIGPKQLGMTHTTGCCSGSDVTRRTNYVSRM